MGPRTSPSAACPTESGRIGSADGPERRQSSSSQSRARRRRAPTVPHSCPSRPSAHCGKKCVAPSSGRSGAIWRSGGGSGGRDRPAKQAVNATSPAATRDRIRGLARPHPPPTGSVTRSSTRSSPDGHPTGALLVTVARLSQDSGYLPSGSFLGWIRHAGCLNSRSSLPLCQRAATARTALSGRSRPLTQARGLSWSRCPLRDGRIRGARRSLPKPARRQE